MFEQEHPRSPHWPACRAAFLKDNPKCAACGSILHLNVHHKQPYHLFPEKELDPTNLITLCETPTHNCHFNLGHFFNWSFYNERVVELVQLYSECFTQHRKEA